MHLVAIHSLPREPAKKGGKHTFNTHGLFATKKPAMLFKHCCKCVTKRGRGIVDIYRRYE